MRVLYLTRYDRQGASSRLRSLQYFPYLREHGLEITHWPLFDDAYLQALYRGQSTLWRQGSALMRRMWQLLTLSTRTFDAVWLEKEALPFLPYAVEQALLPKRLPLIIDFDDAIFHHYDQHPRAAVRRLLSHKIDRLMARADLITAGSPYLYAHARDQNASWVEYLPTVVDLERYPLAAINPAGQRIGWMGTPKTVKYLLSMSETWQALAAQQAFTLVIVGATGISIPGVQVECHPWSEASEAEAIASFDIGIMPLADSPWERGKCGYKLIQYMACGRPVIASPVGVNQQLVHPGVNGMLADSHEQWLRACKLLLQDASLRERLGLHARHDVEQRYCLQQTAPQLLRWLQRLAPQENRT